MKLLFITHETSRTGAPMVLLHFLKWLQLQKLEIKVDVLALRGGYMEADFKASCTSYYNYAYETKVQPLSLLKRLLSKLGVYKPKSKRDLFIANLANKDFDVIYANTVVSMPIAAEINTISFKSKVLAHIHELNAIIKIMLPNFKYYLSDIDQFIVPSKLVKSNLIANWSVSQNYIEVVYECTTVDNTKQTNKESDEIFTVGASGYVHWRKGHDVFLQLARYMHSNYPESNINFVWVGKLPLKEQIILEADIQKLELEDVVSFIGEVENPTSSYNNFDVFVMTSREDPFPLVCIEVGMLGKPIISFDKAVGTNEVLSEAGGFIVPYLDIESMANRIMKYYNNPELVKKHGELNEKAFSRFTPEVICPQLFKIITSHSKA